MVHFPSLAMGYHEGLWPSGRSSRNLGLFGHNFEARHVDYFDHLFSSYSQNIMSHGHTHGPGTPANHTHGPPQMQQAQMPQQRPAPDPILQAAIEADFKQVSLCLGDAEKSNSIALCKEHKKETCTDCGLDFTAMNAMAKMFAMAPADAILPPPNVIAPQRGAAVSKTKDEGNVTSFLFCQACKLTRRSRSSIRKTSMYKPSICIQQLCKSPRQDRPGKAVMSLEKSLHWLYAIAPLPFTLQETTYRLLLTRRLSSR